MRYDPYRLVRAFDVSVSILDKSDVVYGGVVLSSKPHAKILKVDTTEALRMNGDIPKGGTNYPGSLLQEIFGADDSPIFADGEVLAVGQPIGLMVAKDSETTRRAARMVKVTYQELPAVLTMEVCSAFRVIQHEYLVLASTRGTTRSGCQDHCYMEPQGSIAIPGKNDELTIHTSTESANLHQLFTSAVLGIPAHKVERVGGAFGGKYTQSAPAGAWAAVAARVLNRPVKVVLKRAEDMLITGKRHPAMVKYRVGIDVTGMLRCAYLKVYLDGGYAIDASNVVTYMATALSDTCYSIPVMRAEGYALKTNKSNNTFIMKMNFNKNGGVRLSKEPIINDALLECWKECMKWSDFDELREEVDRFNKTSNHIKRGIAMSATRMGLAPPAANEQAAALVQISKDGSVAVTIGGVEMDRELITKCQHVASRALRACCEKLMVGLRPILKEEPDWRKAVLRAHKMRLPLQASEHIGHCTTPPVRPASFHRSIAVQENSRY
ncbi:aldehyde oxidase and xanthine dehydrogenase, a/b hammerhead domain protein [Teladorsagia circumcincta]|uniref:Aldehyde oxidase and xanthine dehydrogenase, a/b hammerhead domain protein n=1 Tax=Teladorsagia circumcincta TaxID=45464 RepID=A0A2G9U749_TELCI|nr:aldehyde oxidase and xanthine dehydrogenase, a/b hammerhead domain protein [Teladorsagia circumcincta]